MKMRFASQALWLAAVACGAGGVGAAPVIDAPNDFLPSYRGISTGDLDVLSAFVTYDTRNDTFFFSGTFAAPVGTTPSAFYVVRSAPPEDLSGARLFQHAPAGFAMLGRTLCI